MTKLEILFFVRVTPFFVLKTDLAIYKVIFIMLAFVCCSSSYAKNNCLKTVSEHSRQEVIYDRLNAKRMTSAQAHLHKLEVELKSLDFETMELINESTASEVYKVKLKNGQLAIWKPEPKHWKSNDPSTATDFNLHREVVAYEISKRFGFFNVPVTVERVWQGQRGSLQAFVKRDESSYKHKSLSELRIIDWFVGQFDRAPLCDGNCLRYKGNAVGFDNGLFTQANANFKKQQLLDINFNETSQQILSALNSSLSTIELVKLTDGKLNKIEIEYLLNSHQLLNQHLQPQNFK